MFSAVSLIFCDLVIYVVAMGMLMHPICLIIIAI